jgi:hypothetical protein
MKNYFNAFCPHVQSGFSQSACNIRGGEIGSAWSQFLTMEQYRYRL